MPVERGQRTSSSSFTRRSRTLIEPDARRLAGGSSSSEDISMISEDGGSGARAFCLARCRAVFLSTAAFFRSGEPSSDERMTISEPAGRTSTLPGRWCVVERPACLDSVRVAGMAVFRGELESYGSWSRGWWWGRRGDCGWRTREVDW